MADAWDGLDADFAMEPSRSKHGCSGKHAGFLTLAVHLGADPARYLDPAAPVQQAVLARLAECFDLPPADLEIAVDGCGAPVACVSARRLATGLTTLLRDDEDGARIVRAIGDHPWATAGAGRFDTRVTAALRGNGFTKIGAEGCRVAVLGDPGITIAMKALSGDRRAVDAVMFRMLTGHDAFDPSDLPDLAAAEILDSTGRAVGGVHVRGLDGTNAD